MIKAMFWKEWREHRLKYAAYWLVLNLPMLVVAACVTLIKGARAPFADLNDAGAMKFLGLSLVAEAYALAIVFSLVTGFLAAATFSPELEDRSQFFLFEQPVARWKLLACKLAHGLLQVAAAVSFAVLFAPTLAWLLMVLGGKVSVAGTLGTLGTVLWAGLKAAGYLSLMSAAAYCGCALVTTLMPKWWLATAGSIVLIVVGGILVGDYFDLLSPAFETLKDASVGLGAGSPQWLTITKALPLAGFPAWKAGPLLAALGFAGAMCGATGWIWTRKELK